MYLYGVVSSPHPHQTILQNNNDLRMLYCCCYYWPSSSFAAVVIVNVIVVGWTNCNVKIDRIYVILILYSQKMLDLDDEQ